MIAIFYVDDKEVGRCDVGEHFPAYTAEITEKYGEVEIEFVVK